MSDIVAQPSGSSKPRYHHGDLRTALIQASMRLLTEKRVETFSVADAAHAAGVSSGAPYRHFSDRDDLLDHVAAAGFDALQERTDAAWLTRPIGSIEGLVEGGCAYIAFGRENPELFHLMWGATRPHAEGGAAVTTGTACFEAFLTKLSKVMQAEGLHAITPQEFVTPLWAMVHGYASLLIGQNKKLVSDQASVRAQVDAATRAYFAGTKLRLGPG